MNLWSPLVEKFPFCAHTTTRGGGGQSNVCESTFQWYRTGQWIIPTA